MNARLLLPLLALLTGCGSPPAFLGDAADGPLFVARLSRFHGDTGFAGQAVTADGCQLSLRGEVPRGVVGNLHAGQCHAELWQEPDAPAGSIDSEPIP